MQYSINFGNGYIRYKCEASGLVGIVWLAVVRDIRSKKSGDVCGDDGEILNKVVLEMGGDSALNLYLSDIDRDDLIDHYAHFIDQST